MSNIHHLAQHQARKLKWCYFRMGALTVFTLNRSTVERYSAEVARFLKDSHELAKLLGMNLDDALTSLMRWRKAGQVISLLTVATGLAAVVTAVRSTG